MFGETQPPRGAARLRRRTQMPVFRQFNHGDQRHSGRWSLQWFATVCKSGLTRRRSDGPSRGIQTSRRALAGPQTRWKVAGRWKAALRPSALNGDSGAVGPGAAAKDLPRLPRSATGSGVVRSAATDRAKPSVDIARWLADRAPNGDSADDPKRLQRRHHDRHRRVNEPLQVAEPAQQFERRLPLGRVGRLIYGLGHQHHGREGNERAAVVVARMELMPDLRPILDKRGSPRLGVEDGGCGR